MNDCTHERLYVKAADETFHARIGCLDCNKWMQSVEVKGGRLYTRAEVLALMERVREECEDAATGYADETGSAARDVRAVDVARLLEET